MPLYTFVARTAAGQPQRGTEEAASAPALAGTLRQRGWLVLDIQPAAGSPGVGDLFRSLNPLAWLPPRSLDVELSLQQLAVMLRSGLTLLVSLKTIAEYARRTSMRLAWEAVADKIQRGSGLADAMTEHRCFTRIVLELVRV